ncbi:MAG: site-specific integrase [Actinomycetota bacterium]|nr:site-specific integrase [Actinomycetota bacterium]
MSVYKRIRADGREVYDVKVSVRGRQIMERGLGFDEAQDRDLELKRLRRRSPRSGSGLTVSELADAWLEEKELRNKRSSYLDYEQCVRLRIKPELGDWKVRRLTPYQVSRFVSGLADRPRTANKTLTALKQMLKLAVIWGIISASPAADVSKIPEDQAEVEYLTPEEVGKVLEVMEGQKYLLVLTAALTGMRSAELRGLPWADVEGSYIHVRREYRAGEFQEPKTRSSRQRVLMPPFLSEKLEAARGDPDGLVFHGKGKPLADGYPTRYALKTALERAEVKGVTFHALRHSCAAWMLSEGESPKFVQLQLGHTDPAFTLRRYGHFMPDAHQKLAERMEKKIVSRMAVSKLYHKRSEQEAEVI